MTDNNKKTGLGTLFGYAAGEGATSIIMNGTGNFYLLYLTQILGMNAVWAALSFSICTLWDAVTDPIMGHISDNTRSRWGQRHPYILIGGVFTAFFFFSYWTFPRLLHGPVMIFSAVLLISLLIRTAITVFMVPYMALGFEVCPEYESRTHLQGVRFFVNQSANFMFGALAWTLFFPDGKAADGSRLDGTFMASHYSRMGAALALGAMVLILICVFSTRRFVNDNRSQHVQGKGFREFWIDFSSIFKNRLAVLVFVFFIVAQFSMILTGTMQMFTYVNYMQLTAVQKTCVHGGGMLAFAFAAFNVSKLVARVDKKGAGYTGAALASFGGFGLLAVFTGGVLTPMQTLTVAGHTVPLAVMVFGLLQACWWGGCGMVVPLANSMVADVAAIAELRTGESRNASYAAVFSFSTKAAASVGVLICGLLVNWSGIVSGAETQTAEAVRNISILTFVCGPAVILASLLILRRYPVTREYMAQLENHKGLTVE